MATKTESEIRAKRIESMQAHIPGLPEADALILSQALFFLPATDKRQPEGAIGIADRAFSDFDLQMDDYFHNMLFTWLTNTTTGAAKARLDKLVVN